MKFVKFNIFIFILIINNYIHSENIEVIGDFPIIKIFNYNSNQKVWFARYAQCQISVDISKDNKPLPIYGTIFRIK
ncbi:MAG: hypothetical protein OEZ22_14920 [Spirochaetia bacterium]|nr:hypothetical protein [Spirochaetia bacterium]